jgi:hypothetical protein
MIQFLYLRAQGKKIKKTLCRTEDCQIRIKLD